MEHFTHETLPRQLLRAPTPVLVEFSARWCGYCRRIAPAMDQIERELNDRMTVGQVDIDEQPALAAQYGVETIPALLLFRRGEPGPMLIAPGSKAQIDQWLAEQGVE